MDKKLLNLILVCTIVILSFSDYATANASENHSMDQYATGIIAAYLRANEVAEGICYLSQAYAVYDTDIQSISHYVYFVQKDENIIGRLIVYWDENMYHSIYINGSISNIDKKTPFKLFQSSNSMFIRVNNTNFFISGEKENINFTEEIPVTAKCLQDNNIIIYPFKGRSSMTHYYLDVPYVANRTDKGWCWAACIAARVNYHQKTSYSAEDIFNACNAPGTQRPSGTPKGFSQWIQYGYSLYGINTTIVHSGRTFAQICDLLSRNIPIYCGVDNGVDGHAILLIGVHQEGTSTNIYMFRDPNISSGIVSINVNSDVLYDSSLFSYYTNMPNATIYNNWSESIY